MNQRLLVLLVPAPTQAQKQYGFEIYSKSNPFPNTYICRSESETTFSHNGVLFFILYIYAIGNQLSSN